MPEIRKGSFSLDLGVFKMQAEVSEDDRQCAWEVYTEMVTRVAVCGKTRDGDCADFSGEVLAESLSSLYAFLLELRALMRRFPVGRLSLGTTHHLGVLINDIIVNVLRPFLERWQACFRYWWETEADKQLPPVERQRLYPEYEQFLQDWTAMRALMRAALNEIASSYELVGVHDQKRLLGSRVPAPEAISAPGATASRK